MDGRTRSDEDRRPLGLFAVWSIVVATTLRLVHIADPATLNLHIIRQMTGAMVARSLLNGEGTLLRPTMQVAWWPYHEPWAISLEFPLVPQLTVLLYRLFGERVWLGNVLSVVFSGLAAWAFFLLARRMLRSTPAVVTALTLFLFLPEAYKYSRVILPDPLGLLLGLAVIEFTFRFVDAEKNGRNRAGRGWLIAVTVSAALMLLDKVNFALFLLPALSVVVVCAGPRRLMRWDILAALAVVVVPSGYYYGVAARAAEFQNVTSIASDLVGANLARNFLNPEFWSALSHGLLAWLLPPGVLLFAAGLVAAVIERRRESAMPDVLLVWAISTFVYFYVLGPRILGPHLYYFLPVLPVAALLVGVLVDAVQRRVPAAERITGRSWAWAGASLCVVLALGSWAMLRGYYRDTHAEMVSWTKLGMQVAADTRRSDRVLYLTEDWGTSLYVAYVADRNGYTFGDVPAVNDFRRVLSAVARERRVSRVVVSSGVYSAKYLAARPEAAENLVRDMGHALEMLKMVSKTAVGTDYGVDE